MNAQIKTVFFDVGGVLLTNAWDHAQRRQAVERFALDAADFDAAHARLGPEMECGTLSLHDYLGQAVFDRPRPFTPAEFIAFMKSRSEPFDDSLELLPQIHARLAALNNEGVALNEYRIARFGLARHIHAFCSSCYLGARKPDPEIYRRAMGIMQALPSQSLFVDDRSENLEPARELGMDCVLFTSAEQLRQELLARHLL
ncbi:MAG TPA: HAD family phosphatase [Terriglobales bacterium]|nr:HAD family phosphatase [Terriglobales bacterium]